MRGFVSGLERFLSHRKEEPLSTGSPELDSLLGGIRRESFYYFYGDQGLIEDVFMHILVNALRPTDSLSKPRAVYALCGNYRVEKTLIGTEDLVKLLEASELPVEDALRRIHILTASSADQQTLLANGLERILEHDSEVNIVLVKGIFKLHRDDARTRKRGKVREEVQRSTMRLRQICASRNVSLVASGRAEKRKRGLPQPEGSSFLKHLANVIVYLRRRGKGSEYARAYVLKTPVQCPKWIEYGLEVKKEMGRSTPPFRASFQETVSKLRRGFRDALLNKGRREAFDGLVEAWSGELGAMSFAESITLFDLMLLVAAVENQSMCNDLLRNTGSLTERVKQLEERIARAGL